MAAARSVGRNRERDAALIWICYSQALRISELVALRWQDLSFANRTMIVDRRYQGGREEREMSPEDIEILGTLRALPISGEYLFCSERKEAMRTRVVHAIIARAGRIAGFGDAINAQALRDSRGRAMAREGKSASEIAAFLGNKQVRSSRSGAAHARSTEESRVFEPDLTSLCLEDLPIDEDQVSRRISVLIPASTCNLGPGLDTLGLALSLYTRITVWLLKKDYTEIPRVIFRGAMAKRSQASDQGDLIYTMLMKLWESTPRDASRLRVLADSDIPLGTGLGGTGTAVLGALWASAVLRDIIPTRTKILADATALEHHPESLAPSLLGNMVVCGIADGLKVLTEQIEWPQQWRTIVLVPSYRLTTPKARAVLPGQVNLADAVFNVQRASLLVAAVQNQNEGTMRSALHDRLHERYRTSLVPELSEIKAILAREPIMGCVLSGAGSAVLVIVNDKRKDAVVRHLRDWIAREKKGLTLLDLSVDRFGLREIESETF